jgi:predicted LPLAT superfamily acyltransferase
MENSRQEWEGVTGGHTVGQKALKWFFALVDVRAGYAILALVIPFYMLFAHRGYISIYRYFRERHGCSPLKAFRRTYRNHFLFGQALLDRFAVYAGQGKRFQVENPDNARCFLPLLDMPEGCIIAGAHVGNPELCGYLLKQTKKRINCLIFGNEAREVQRNRTATLEHNSVRLLPVTDDMSHIFLINGARAGGEMVSMPCDRTFGSAKCVPCDFLGGRAEFPVGAFVLAVQFRVPVIALFVMKTGTLRYRIHVTPVRPPEENLPKREQIDAMTRAFARELEQTVHRYPEQWFNFYSFWKQT